MTFSIKTPVFEGPLDLLLSLIEKRKLFINDIALAEVADEYMEHLRALETFPTKDVAQFVLIASTLVLIKSKSLLPEFTLSAEEESDVRDLQDRLVLYREMQELSRSVRERFGKRILFSRSFVPTGKTVLFAPHPSITVEALSRAAQSILDALPKTEVLKKAVVEKVMSLEEMMSRLANRIQGALRLRFSEFAKHHTKDAQSEREAKVGTIVGFLAMLELVKQGVLLVKQHESFSDIEMHTDTVSVPSYT